METVTSFSVGKAGFGCHRLFWGLGTRVTALSAAMQSAFHPLTQCSFHPAAAAGTRLPLPIISAVLGHIEHLRVATSAVSEPSRRGCADHPIRSTKEGETGLATVVQRRPNLPFRFVAHWSQSRHES